MTGRRMVSSLLAEFIGTYALASVMVAMLVRTNFEFFSAVAAAVVYGAMWIILGSVSGSNLNPAVTIGLWTMKRTSSAQAVVNIVGQVLGGLAAWGTAQYFLNQTLQKTATGGLNWRVATAEAVGAAIFGFGIAAAMVKDGDNKSRQAAVVGLALLAGILVASLGSNGLLNPAAAIAVRSISWAYVLGPIVGVIFGMYLYVVVFTDKILGKAPVAKKKK